MLTKIMKVASIASLLVAAFWRSSASYQVFLQIMVCVTAILVLTQAIRTRKYWWGAGLVAIAALLNPVVPVMLSGRIFLWLDWVCLMTFLISLAALRWQPRLTIPPIASQTPRSESL